MRGDAAAEQDTASGVIPSAPWRISDLEVLADFRLRVRFVDGTEGIVDLSRLIFDSGAGVFAPLRDPAIFVQAYLQLGCVTWPGEIDLAPDAMHRQIMEHGEWLV